MAAAAGAGAAARLTRMRQVDAIEFFTANRPLLKQVTAERWKMEKGLVAYAKDAVDFIREMRSVKKEPTPPKEGEAGGAAAGAKKTLSTVDQYYASQDLLKRMKWKRVTWDDDADFDAFQRRLMDNDTVFNQVPAFSHMTLHLVHDKAARAASIDNAELRRVVAIKPGTLSKWFFEERQEVVPKPAFVPPPKTRQAPYAVDWEAGTVRILDTASVQELLVYLTTTAPQVQALQQRMEEDQTKIAEDLDSARVRLGVTAIKFNEYDKSFWDDPKRIANPSEYVTPAEVRLFIDSVNKRSLLLRRYVKNNQLRIVPSGRPYAIDAEAKEIRIPANFAEYNYLRLHDRWENIERIFNFFRATAMVWFFVGMMLVGDFELL